jgi:glucose-6-phosphate 1-dehydrogenase
MTATAPTSPSHSDPSLIVIFGITGDLSQRYLLPALYHLIKDGLLDEHTEIIGISRRDITSEQLFQKVELCVNEIDNICDPDALQAMHQRTRLIQMDLDAPVAYADLLKTLNGIEEQKGLCLNRLYYLSIPPSAYRPVIRHMGEAGLNASCQHGRAMTRVLVEKPFGFDLSSAKELISETAAVFGEEQIFRIDHFLAKETVQNILTFRFHNPIFEALWSREHITGIEISASEQIGIEGRAQFYEPLGALRDFIQNHLLQILGIVTMDQPSLSDSEHIHIAKQALLEQVLPVPADAVVTRTTRGQYKGYRDEVDNPDSVTETYASITVYIDNPRWQGVPISLWTGKALAAKKYEICITFQDAQDITNTGKAVDSGQGASNRLRFRIQPNEGIELDLLTKKPGFDDELQTVAMDFSYAQNFEHHEHPNAYERVLMDAMRGDHTLFATSQEVLASWRIIQPVLDQWAKGSDDLVTYEPGTMGPLPAQSQS